MGKIYISDNLIKNLLKNVYFINGTAYAGKSTMVRMLAEKYNGIECGENYHDKLMHLIDGSNQPNLKYFDTMSGWQEFVNRTPEEYDDWIQGVAKEAAEYSAMFNGLMNDVEDKIVDVQNKNSNIKR